MKTLVYIIIGIAVLFAIGTFVFSRESDPKERAKEAGGAAAVGAAYSLGCILSTVISAIPVIIGIGIILLIMRSCR